MGAAGDCASQTLHPSELGPGTASASATVSAGGAGPPPHGAVTVTLGVLLVGSTQEDRRWGTHVAGDSPSAPPFAVTLVAVAFDPNDEVNGAPDVDSDVVPDVVFVPSELDGGRTVATVVKLSVASGRKSVV